jgi:ankyrin repeat protein
MPMIGMAMIARVNMFRQIEHVININLQDKSGRTVLHNVALTGPLPDINFLLEHGADISVQDKYGHTALHLATVADYLR